MDVFASKHLYAMCIADGSRGFDCCIIHEKCLKPIAGTLLQCSRHAQLSIILLRTAVICF